MGNCHTRPYAEAPWPMIASLRRRLARRSLKPQLNQIRTWVRQGRTDAWIAHQLEVSVGDIRSFKREHELVPDEGTNGDCLLYTSDATDDLLCVDLGGRRIIKKK